MADPQNIPKRALTEDLHASNVASNTSNPSFTDPDLASQLRNVAMRARRNVSQGYATNKDSLQPGPSSRIKSLSTNDIFRSSNDIMHDILLSNPREPTSLHPSRKRARSEDRDADSNSAMFSCNNEFSMALENSVGLQVAERPIKPLRKPGKTNLYTRSLPASLWPGNRSDSMNDLEEEEDWSTLDDPSGSKPFEPMVLS
ncbi:hypothetical protein L218DRAFT_1003712 [Marasmius fiardii PR-910]|nr:hypothetical protein L218DRAFT_1003712 [Marasmius fiardii PR-910]